VGNLTRDVCQDNSGIFNNYISTKLYSSPSIIRIIKSRRNRWAGHVAGMGEKRIAYRILVGKPEEKETTGKTRA
jgi:hypothetical protein